MVGRAAPTAADRSGERRCRRRRRRQIRRSRAPAASGSLAPKRSARRPAARPRQRPDAEIVGGEVSFEPEFSLSVFAPHLQILDPPYGMPAPKFHLGAVSLNQHLAGSSKIVESLEWRAAYPCNRRDRGRSRSALSYQG